MKYNSILRAVVLLLLIVAGCRTAATTTGTGSAGAEAKSADETTIYVVRHAEKDTSVPNNPDPDLTEEGRARANELRMLLQQEKIDALYTTNYKRTKNTLQPLASERGLELFTYDSKDYQGLRQRIMAEQKGKTIVVAGHSNTLIPLVEAFGVEKPFEQIDESEYYYLFKVVVAKDGQAQLVVSRYGNLSRQE
ncbi:histidine phosphatase family protein [Pontibacter sp. SGAir0037]|uniref:histidine phosphatase family protein n=1 Tax=Pontibacter sp. SGAir0037 TaxID=2571030 RepID=UPI0010CD1165|nr:histidine phosphatase family protein [Pontibacter sp. SGAir0037]QCR25072.1 histidine phosphatase family protein [Pontibacter sp. SGAir0037]